MKWNESGFRPLLCTYRLNWARRTSWWDDWDGEMVRWLRWHCPPDTEFEIRALAVWGRARYLSVTEAPRNTDFYTWMEKKHLCFFQTAETGNRTPNSGVKGSGTNYYHRAPARFALVFVSAYNNWVRDIMRWSNVDLSFGERRRRWPNKKPALCLAEKRCNNTDSARCFNRSKNDSIAQLQR